MRAPRIGARLGVRTLNPVRPSAPIRIEYQRRLDAAIEEMHADTVEVLTAKYVANEPALTVYAADASPAIILQKSIGKLSDKWLDRFDTLSDAMAHWFALAVKDRSDSALKSELRKAGMSVRFKMTEPMRDAFDAVRAENVALIKSISSEYMTQVEGLVMRSVSAGRDLGTLAQGLHKRLGITKRRAAFIARDQNNKATAVMTRARQLSMGIDEGIWLHSAGGKVPRPPHVAFSGKRFKLAKGHDFGDGAGFTLPGCEPGCRCVWKPVIPGFDD